MFTSVRRATQRLWFVTRGCKSAATTTCENVKQNATSRRPDATNLLRPNKYDRLVPTLSPSSLPLATKGSAINTEESKEFISVFSDILKDLRDTETYHELLDASEWLCKVLEYNVLYGKKNRALTIVSSYKILAKPQDLTPENIRLAMILGWCSEMLYASLLVSDDVMDKSETRNGLPCWYKKHEVGLTAINDALLLETVVYAFVRKYFLSKPYYVNLLHTLHDGSLKIYMAQSIDMLANQSGKCNFDMFTLDSHRSLIKYKFSYFSLLMPATLALHMVGFNDSELYKKIEHILFEMGHILGVQNDYLDCFGDPALTGKIGTDIQEGKFSWLVVIALQKASPKHRQVIEDCYGSSNPQKVEVIKNLYEELGLPQYYADYEEKCFHTIKNLIQEISDKVPQNLFSDIMENLHRRDY